MTDATRPTSPVFRRPQFLVPILAAVLIGVVAVVLFFVWKSRTPALDGELVVRITAADRNLGGVAVNEPGVVPVRAGESMAVEARFSEPAYCYLLWLDSQGRAVPLYPWNNDETEVQDANAPPPARGPTKVVFSPMTITIGWKFGAHGGLETVLLLARRTPLPPDVKLGDLLGALPPARMRAREEVVSLRFDQGQAAASTPLAQNRGDEAEARESDRPLVERMDKLRAHFEVIRALRFAHEGE
jgi:hypothetical protein